MRGGDGEDVRRCRGGLAAETGREGDDDDDEEEKDVRAWRCFVWGGGWEIRAWSLSDVVSVVGVVVVVVGLSLVPAQGFQTVTSWDGSYAGAPAPVVV
jgi:hypothetical protein